MMRAAPCNVHVHISVSAMRMGAWSSDSETHQSAIHLTVVPIAHSTAWRVLHTAWHVLHTAWRVLHIAQHDACCTQRGVCCTTLQVVKRGRGGYCFELNTLFSALLTGMGFSVRPGCARVVMDGLKVGS